jgi:hypothetical protein
MNIQMVQINELRGMYRAEQIKENQAIKNKKSISINSRASSAYLSWTPARHRFGFGSDSE